MAHEFPYGILSPVVGLFVTEIWKPIKKHFGYCLKPGRKVKDLATATTGLKSIIQTIDEQIQLGKTPRELTTECIKDFREVEAESSTITNEYSRRSTHMFGYSWNCIFNYRIGRAAAKTMKKVDDLSKITPKVDDIFSLLPPVGRELPLPPNIAGQHKYMEEIVACIRQGPTSFIGICGMGGAGKTTLLKQLNNIFFCSEELHKFDHVIYAEIGQQQNLGTIQQSIASQLGLTLGNDESTTARSASIYKFLKERKFLLLMDNLWKSVDLVELGIPQAQIDSENRQVIVITTRDQQISHRMQADGKLVLLQRLKPDEAWSLFEANACYSSLTTSRAEIRVYAESIVEKCGGLPLALKIMGQSMALKENEHEWKSVVMSLRQSQFHKVPDADGEKDLFEVLYISYNQLPDERTKKCFLFFAMLSHYDFKYVPHTIDFWMGHGLLDEHDDISNRYSTGHSIVGCLKRACLLEEHPRGQNYLRMHDTIRGLALWIVESKQGDGPRKNWIVRDKETLKPEVWRTAHRISLKQLSNVVIPDSFSCRWLSTLIMKNIGNGIPTGFFKAAPSLTFLDLSQTNIRELPSDIGELVNLQHLNLDDTPIQSIPMELQLLKSLRYLYLGQTYDLQTIPDGIISALSMLRVLNLYNTGIFSRGETLAYIQELESLTSLQSLGFCVRDSYSLQRILNTSIASLNSLAITMEEGLQHLHITSLLFSKTRARELERLSLQNMGSLIELSIGEDIVHSDWYFKNLDELTLLNLEMLKSIVWKGVVPHACLPRLRLLVIGGCPGIRSITWIKQLPCLEEVYLFDCDSMLEVAADDGGTMSSAGDDCNSIVEVAANDGGPMSSAGNDCDSILEVAADDGGTMSSAAVSFPRLKLLGLSCLGNLQNICDGTVEFLCLQRLLVYKCPLLAKLPSGLAKPEHAPLILGEQDWWEQLSWEDSSVKSTTSSFFRDLPASFEGNVSNIYRALAH